MPTVEKVFSDNVNRHLTVSLATHHRSRVTSEEAAFVRQNIRLAEASGQLNWPFCETEKVSKKIV